MSEYQYYEFLAVDRPLSAADQRWLRGISSRADITSASFINTYNWGDLKGDPAEMTARCFDAFVYVSNFGCCRFMVRLPEGAVDEKLIKPYCDGFYVELSRKPGCLLLTFTLDDDPIGWYEPDEGAGWMASLAPLRDALLRGDMRPLYTGWLQNVQNDDADDDLLEPPPPPGLKESSAALETLIDFLHIDRNLVEIAAQTSAPAVSPEESSREFIKWLRSLPDAEKDDLLTQFTLGAEPALRTALRTRFLKEASPDTRRNAKAAGEPRRTVGELRNQWRIAVEEKQRRLEEKAARERKRQAEEQARARREYLTKLAQRLAPVWKEVEALAEKRTPKSYDQAVALLLDLRDASAINDKQADFSRRLRRFRERHERKGALIKRLSQTGLD